jgi:Lrp/AsnC family transcriptional regulator, regulator for asnA, asnC and gidA
MKKDEPNFDHTDIRILSLLMHDAKLSYSEISKKIATSIATVHQRIKKLEEQGIIKKTIAVIDYEMLGYDITAFLGIYLSKSSMYDKVAEELKKIPEVISLNYTTGNYSMFAKIICKDTQHLREVLHDKIQKIGEISRTETLISLENSFERSIQL